MELRILWLILGVALFLIIFSLFVASQVYWFRRVWRLAAGVRPAALRGVLWGLVVALAMLLDGRILLFPFRLHLRWPAVNYPPLVMMQGLWGAASLGSFLLLKSGHLARQGMAAVAARVRPLARTPADDPPNPSRRYLFTTAAYMAGAAPFAAVGYGFLTGRLKFTVAEVDVPMPGLPAALDGLRLVQLTDIHIGSYLNRQELARAVGLANELGGELGFVTGDFVNSLGDPLEDSIEELARLKTVYGIFGCNGNHEIYADVVEETKPLFARRGVHLLRHQNVALDVRGARLNLIGVDYQRQDRPMLVNIEPLIERGMPNILLCHNPNGFRRASQLGIDLTIAGHTHGGQVTFEILHSRLNVARFFTPWVAGLYREGKSHVYVSRGIGTVFTPVRLGVPPEITLLRLRRA